MTDRVSGRPVGRIVTVAALGVAFTVGGAATGAMARQEPGPPAGREPAQAPPRTPPAEPPRRGLGGLLDRAGERLRAEATKRLDRNGDGRIDDAERAAALDTLKKKGGELEGQARALLLARFDADSDGRLDDAERARAFDELMTQVDRNGPLVKSTILGAAVRRFDVDGDGRLDDAERAALGDEVARRWLGQADGPAAAEPRAITREALRKILLGRFDADGDGRLDDAERAAARTEVESILGDAGRSAAGGND